MTVGEVEEVADILPDPQEPAQTAVVGNAAEGDDMDGEAGASSRVCFSPYPTYLPTRSSWVQLWSQDAL